MNGPVHTVGPLEFLEAASSEMGFNRGNPLTITEATAKRNDVANIYSADDSTVSITREEAVGNARLFTAAHNAFSLASKRLGINAVECAERMANGGVADLVDALDHLLAQTVDMDLKSGITLSEGEEDARARAIAIIAKVKGVEL